jgi:lipid-A-disaccharide synthase
MASEPGCSVLGMAGAACREAGVGIEVDSYRYGSVMGFSEVVARFGSIVSSFKRMKAVLKAERPDLLVLVDYPDFNLRLARFAKSLGIPVLYFIPPKVWAWRKGRVEFIKRYVDRVVAIFPFERNFYERHGYDRVSYAGHPLADQAVEPGDDNTRQQSVLLLPGSRNFEVQKLLPPMLKAFAGVREAHPELTGTVLVAPSFERARLEELARRTVGRECAGLVTWKSGPALPEMRVARAGILKSGTCNLEGALAGLPFVSVYSGSPLTKMIVKMMVPLSEYSPVNIIRSQTVPEVMDVNVSEQVVRQKLEAVLQSGSGRSSMLEGLGEVRRALMGCDPEFAVEKTVAERVAGIVRATARNGGGSDVS